MILSNKKYLNIENLDLKIKKAFKFLEENDIKSFEPGTYKICGEEVFVNIVHYETKDKSERFWEGHKEYLDIHYIFSGVERINIAFKDSLTFTEYKEDEDFLGFQGKEEQSLILKEDDYLILYPEDIHMTCLKAREKNLVKKAIFKVRL